MQGGFPDLYVINVLGRTRGDGVADDTVHIRDAIDELVENTSSADTSIHGGVIYFPPAIYRTTAEITVSSGGITLIGATNGASQFYTDHDGVGIRFAPVSPLANVRSNRVRNLRFRSSVTDRVGGSVSLQMDGALEFDISGNWFNSRQERNIYLHGCLDGIVSRNRIDSPTGAGAAGAQYGIHLDSNAQTGANQITVENNWIENCNEAGMLIEGDGSYNSILCSVRENLFQGCNGDGLQIYKTIALNLVRNWFEDNGRDGLSGRGHIVDKSLSTANGHRAFRIDGGVLGGAGATAHADFCAVKLMNAVAPSMRGVYLATSSRLNFNATNVHGLVVKDNWTASGSPTFVDQPSVSDIENNFTGNTGSAWS